MKNCTNCLHSELFCKSCKGRICKDHLKDHLKLKKGLHVILTEKRTKNEDLKLKFYNMYQFLQKFRLNIHKQMTNLVNEMNQRLIQMSKLLSLIERRYQELYSTFAKNFRSQDIKFNTSFTELLKPSKLDLDFSLMENPSKKISLKDSLLAFYSSNMSGLRCLKVTETENYLITGGFDYTIRIWNLLIKKQEFVLLGHKGTVNSVSISLDSSLLLSGSDDRTVRLWDFETRTEKLSLLGHESAVMSVDISANNKYGFSGSIDKTILCWHLLLKTKIFSFKADSSIFCVKSIKENILFGTENGSLKKLCIESNTVVSEETFHIKALFAVEVSKDHKLAVTGGLDGTICCWDLENFSISHRLINPNRGFHSLALDPFATICISGSSDSLIMVWDLKSCTMIYSIKILNGTIFGVYLSKNKEKIYSASHGGALDIFNFQEKKTEEPLFLEQFLVGSLAISNNLQFLACAYDELKLYNLSNNKKLELGYEKNESIAFVNLFSNDSSFLLTGYINGNIILRYVCNPSILKSWKATSTVALICISHDDKLCAYYSKYNIIGRIDLNDTKIKEITKKIEITAMAFHTDNKSLILCTKDGKIKKVNNQTIEIIYDTKQVIISFCYSKDYLFLCGIAKFNIYFCIDIKKKIDLFKNEDQCLIEKILSKFEGLQLALNY